MTDHFVNKTSTPEDIKDLWQTPKSLFNALDREFSFCIDVCSSDDNSLCILNFTEKNSCLDHEWDWVRNYEREAISAYMNPPYSKTQEFLKRAELQAKKHNITVVALVNANTDTKWFAEAVETANEIRLITGRVGFIRADGKKANGNTKGQCLIIWRGNCETPCQITMVDRDQLLADSDI
jgi:phage N-6-adenine-methyltransferase